MMRGQKAAVFAPKINLPEAQHCLPGSESYQGLET